VSLLTRPRVVLGLALVAALFGAAFVIGSATAGSDRGKVGQPSSLQASTEDVRVPTLKRVEDLPSLRELEARSSANKPRADAPPDTPGKGKPPPPPPPPENELPIAAFTFEPNAVLVGETVTFDASGSRDPDGSIVKYEWDLDGNGTFETDTGSDKASRPYETAGSKTVVLRVTDNDKDTSKRVREVIVDEQPPQPE
jgi:YD repeat-containing protein